jgi:hypothetical protein
MRRVERCGRLAQLVERLLYTQNVGARRLMLEPEALCFRLFFAFRQGG